MNRVDQITCDYCGETNTVYRTTNPYNDPQEPARCQHCGTAIVNEAGSIARHASQLAAASDFTPRP